MRHGAIVWYKPRPSDRESGEAAHPRSGPPAAYPAESFQYAPGYRLGVPAAAYEAAHMAACPDPPRWTSPDPASAVRSYPSRRRHRPPALHPAPPPGDNSRITPSRSRPHAPSPCRITPAWPPSVSPDLLDFSCPRISRTGSGTLGRHSSLSALPRAWGSGGSRGCGGSMPFGLSLVCALFMNITMRPPVQAVPPANPARPKAQCADAIPAVARAVRATTPLDSLDSRKPC